MSTQAERLTQARKARGFETASEAATAMGVAVPTYVQHENGIRSFPAKRAEQYGRALGVAPEWLLYGKGPVKGRASAASASSRSAVRIAGRVGAGARVEAIEDANPETVELPTELEDASAYRVEGDSCSPVFEPGDVLVVRGGSRADEGEFLNRYCVVETADGLGWVKRVTRGIEVPGSGRLYTLESDNADPIENQVLKSARPVLLRLIQGGR